MVSLQSWLEGSRDEGDSLVNNFSGYHRDDNLDDVVPPVVFTFQDHYLEVLLGKNSATVDIEQCSVVF